MQLIMQSKDFFIIIVRRIYTMCVSIHLQKASKYKIKENAYNIIKHIRYLNYDAFNNTIPGKKFSNANI